MFPIVGCDAVLIFRLEQCHDRMYTGQFVCCSIFDRINCLVSCALKLAKYGIEIDMGALGQLYRFTISPQTNFLYLSFSAF